MAGLREEALYKIGRNLVNFQRFEKMLKLVIMQSNLSGYSSQLSKMYEEKVKFNDRKTMGLLVDEFLKIYHAGAVSNVYPSTEMNELWVSFNIKFEIDKEKIRTWKHELTNLVRERNFLVHELLAEVDLDSVESCQKLISVLDKQDNELSPQYNSLMRIIERMRTAQQEALKHIEKQLREQILADGNNA